MKDGKMQTFPSSLKKDCFKDWVELMLENEEMNLSLISV